MRFNQTLLTQSFFFFFFFCLVVVLGRNNIKGIDIGRLADFVDHSLPTRRERKREREKRESTTGVCFCRSRSGGWVVRKIQRSRLPFTTTAWVVVVVLGWVLGAWCVVLGAISFGLSEV